MAWSDDGSKWVDGKQYKIVSETITPVGDTLSSHWSSVIDFIPPGS